MITLGLKLILAYMRDLQTMILICLT